MKAIHLTSYGNPVRSLKMIEVPEPKTPSAGEALAGCGKMGQVLLVDVFFVCFS
jgi:hypothetical protein